MGLLSAAAIFLVIEESTGTQLSNQIDRDIGRISRR
jgi:hypothetical protein